MIRTQIEIARAMGGSQMHDTLRVAHLIIFQTALLKMWSEDWILTAISLESQSPTSCLTLQTRFDSVRGLEIYELNTLYSMDELHHPRGAGLGENILEAIATSLIFISALRARVISMARSLITSQ
jgi:hypothetical protein